VGSGVPCWEKVAGVGASDNLAHSKRLFVVLLWDTRCRVLNSSSETRLRYSILNKDSGKGRSQVWTYSGKLE